MSSPDERISAYLDEEMTAPEAEDFRIELQSDPALSSDVDEIAAVRTALRSLDGVDPPLGFFERIVGRERRHRRVGALAGAVALAAAMLILVGATPLVGSLENVVGLDQLVAQHATASPDMSVMHVMDHDDVAHVSMLGEPDLHAMDLSMRHAVRADGTDWVQYEGNDGAMLSVFRQPGRVDIDAMPEDAKEMEMGDDAAWMLKRDGRDVLVAQHDEMVFTVIADEHDTMMSTMEKQLPDASVSIDDRLRGAATTVIDLFSFS